jgi:hypothetical protein
MVVVCEGRGAVAQQTLTRTGMIVEESRMLQVRLQNNLHQVDSSLLLLGVMAIADEVDSQLAQTVASYIAESKLDALTISA